MSWMGVPTVRSNGTSSMREREPRPLHAMGPERAAALATRRREARLAEQEARTGRLERREDRGGVAEPASDHRMPDPGQVHITEPGGDQPRPSAAIFGASADRTKFGNKAVRAYEDAGYDVWPVNPKGDTIEGARTYAGVSGLPDVPHVVSIYLHEEQALDVLEELAELEARTGKKVAELYLNPGADSAKVRERAEEHGFVTHASCSIRAIGRKPTDFGDE